MGSFVETLGFNSYIEPGALGQLALGQTQPQWIKKFPTCGTRIQFWRGSFCHDYGTGTRDIWCKTLRDGRKIIQRNPPIAGGKIHAAHDIHGETGDVLYAVEPGVIQRRNLRESGDGGFIVKLYADPAMGGSGRWYYYAHMQGPGFFGEGAEVVAGDHLGIMDSTGNADSPHLHFQALEMVGGVATPLDVYDELRRALVSEQGEEIALKVATVSGGPINCTLSPGETGVPRESGESGGGGTLLLGLALAAGGAYFLTRSRK